MILKRCCCLIAICICAYTISGCASYCEDYVVKGRLVNETNYPEKGVLICTSVKPEKNPLVYASVLGGLDEFSGQHVIAMLENYETDRATISAWEGKSLPKTKTDGRFAWSSRVYWSPITLFGWGNEMPKPKQVRLFYKKYPPSYSHHRILPTLSGSIDMYPFHTRGKWKQMNIKLRKEQYKKQGKEQGRVGIWSIDLGDVIINRNQNE